MQDTVGDLKVRNVAAGRGVDWLIDGFSIFQKNWVAWIGAILFVVLLSLFSNFVPLLGGLAVQLIFPVFIGGLMSGCQAADQGQNFTFMHLFSGFASRFDRLLIIGVVHMAGIIIILVICGVILLIAAGSQGDILETMRDMWAGIQAIDFIRVIELAAPFIHILLLVELVALFLYVPLLVLIWFAPALVMLENQGIIAAMRGSFVGCMKNIIPFLVYGVIGLVFSIIATVPIFLGWLVLLPMFFASVYLAYKDIFRTA